ncbi:C4-dicarboxylate ABC transporter permease [Pseudaestuariivita atlantica]|uniref:TRAP transporter small permease protein n=1 Tax=Pseudaestuariivita atlantica TaxID=1317121 RepID=A0A0L1JW76_9RHOB|nr:C4-dicarboxylate ABC transporter permease [Pseudaestuariivita atlantica]
MFTGSLWRTSEDPAEIGILNWLSWDNSLPDKQSLMKFVYYGGSVEFFFITLVIVLAVTAYGFYNNRFMWRVTVGLEAIANGVGRFFAWAGLLMVLQQIVIVFMQRIFTRPDISIGFGIPLEFDISWFAEELKLYNALVVALCVTYTFVQGGHVRVDLIYSAVSHRTKRVIDMVGSILFMMPGAILVWMYGWYFLWRHLIVPKVNATDGLDRLVLKARALRWNVETVGFSPNGFTGYFIFKILLVAFAGLIFLHAIAFFYRSYLEFVEGEESEGKYLDRDTLGEGEDAYEGTH